MRVDSGIDLARLLYFLARCEVLVDAIDPHRTRVVERDENVLRRDIGADVDRAPRQPYRRAVRRKGAGFGIDGEGGDMMRRALPAITRGAVAAGDIEIALDACGQAY